MGLHGEFLLAQNARDQVVDNGGRFLGWKELPIPDISVEKMEAIFMMRMRRADRFSCETVAPR